MEKVDSQNGPTLRPRPVVVGVGISVFLVGNAGDLVWWGPFGHVADWWSLASAAAFWLAAAMFVVASVDLVRLFRDGALATGQDGQDSGRAMRRHANTTRRWARRHHAALGAAGLIAGGMVGHLIWKP